MGKKTKTKLPNKIYYTTWDFRNPANKDHYVCMDEQEDGTNVDKEQLEKIIRADLRKKYGVEPFWVMPYFIDDRGYEDADGNGGTLIYVALEWDVDEDDTFDLDFPEGDKAD